MDRIKDIISPIEAVENAQQKAQETLDREAANDRYELTEEGKKQRRDTIYAEVNQKLATWTAKGIGAINAAIEDLNTTEQNDREKRYADTGYITRLREKIALLDSVPVNDDTQDFFKNLFAEFANDGFAIYAINESFKASDMPVGAAMTILPEDHTGEQQKKLENLKNTFIDIMAKAATGEAPSQVELFKQYVRKQDDAFSKDPNQLWAEVYNENSPAKVNNAAAVDNTNGNPFHFDFKPANENQ